jgi:hypothetical protein
MDRWMMEEPTSVRDIDVVDERGSSPSVELEMVFLWTSTPFARSRPAGFLSQPSPARPPELAFAARPFVNGEKPFGTPPV